ncbi:RelA/SpoT family protein [Atopobacter phocae]|uniref:RelA/SpoT family protein n=1 Tax=Atopobacter phocae TaxID=136492 RepID=UPI000472BB09|nr:bifunctional (p)ppGpp synthetase/guanosine-3',5'-bis(diphosphate) 3'-pyrophosphohydrolase [Atopobacter phocae]
MPKKENMTGEEVIEMCRAYMNDESVELVKKSLYCAQVAHKGQYRKSGEPYIIHPIQVAGILAQLKLDRDTVITGFLHDVVEDTGFTLEDISVLFSPIVAQLVDGVTKLGKIKYRSDEEQLAENHRKMLLAMAKDLRVVMVKLSDRLHNIRTLKFQSPEKQKKIAKETLEIYAPLAHRLGMNIIKWELEDTSLRYLNSQAYYRIVHLMDSRRDERELFIEHAISEIIGAIKEQDNMVQPEIYGRPKHIYSIYRKMVDQKKEFSEIYDLLALRIIVNTIRDCYSVLGIIHTKWKPVPGRFKDYIAMPKDNMYQSIHTTVIGPDGKPVEVQIRTKDMHDVAEFGVAAHWAYKEGRTQKVTADPLQKQLDWFKDLLELQQESQDATDFIEGVKEDIFRDKVYVFTPKGDVFELPNGASPLDFAYHIHTDVGHKTVGAKVNGKIVPLNYRLKNGDIIEVMTNSNSNGPSYDWINMVSTRKAKNKIKRFFKMKQQDLYIEKAREQIIFQLKERGFNPKEILNKKALKEVRERFNFATEEDLMIAIGFGDVSVGSIVNKLTEKIRQEQLEEEQLRQLMENDPKSTETQREKRHNKMTVKHAGGAVVEGVDNLLIRLSRCCSPVPGDDIVGYITKGRGISVHRTDCPNVQCAKDEINRLIDMEWEDTSQLKELYNTELIVRGYNRNGLLNEVLNVINSTIKSLKGVNGKIDDNQMAEITVNLGIENVNQLSLIVDKIRSIPDVYAVQRIIS